MRAPCRRFAKRLRRAPQQCARRDPDGEPLWPNPKGPEPAVCEACGAPRRFELQLMAPLVATLEEAADWADELAQPAEPCADPERGEQGDGPSGANGAGATAGGTWGSMPEVHAERAGDSATAGEPGLSSSARLRPPESWECLTVAVLTCSVSCHADGAACFVEEEAVLVNEQ